MLSGCRHVVHIYTSYHYIDTNDKQLTNNSLLCSVRSQYFINTSIKMKMCFIFLSIHSNSEADWAVSLMARNGKGFIL